MADPRTNPSSYFGNFPGTVYGTYGPPQPPSLFGLNTSAPSSPMEGMLQSILPMLSEFLRSRTGGFGFNFGSDMNIAQSQFARDFMQQSMAARSMGAAADSGQINDLLRGMAVMIGHKSTGRDATGRLTFDTDTERAIGRMTGDAGAMLPMLATMFPDYVDRALPRGSMAVAAGSFVNAGRFIIDPATGAPISEDAAYASRVLSPLMARGAGATAGLGAGRLGQTFEALASNGLIGGGSDLRRMVEAGEMGGDDARDIQSGRIRDQIQKYSKTIAAINDIFAESGRPNAPMKELINGLQAMTQGGLNTYDPQSLERIVRSMQGTSQITGIGLGGLTEMTSGAAALLGRFGGHRGLATLIARNAAAMGSVYADGGFGLPSPEGMSRDEWNALVTGKRAAGAGSDFGNMIGALLAQAEIAGGDTPIAAMAAALRAGKLSGGGVDLRSATQADLTGLMTRSGLDPGAFNAQLRATRQNQAMLVRGGGDVMRALDAGQGAEFDATFTRMYGADLSNRGIDLPALMRTMHEVASAGGLSGDAEFVSKVGDRMNLSPAQRSVLMPYLNDIGNQYGTSGYNAFALNSPDVRARGAAEEQRAIDRGEYLSRLTHLGRGGWIRNISNTIRRAGFDGSADWLMTAMQGIGMVTQKDVDLALRTPAIESAAGGAAASFLTGNMGGFIGGLGEVANQSDTRSVMQRAWGSVIGPMQDAEERRKRRGKWAGQADPDAWGGGDFDTAAGKDMNVDMKIAVLTIKKEGGATLTGGGTATI